jgi:hypothetical protein
MGSDGGEDGDGLFITTIVDRIVRQEIALTAEGNAAERRSALSPR